MIVTEGPGSQGTKRYYGQEQRMFTPSGAGARGVNVAFLERDQIADGDWAAPYGTARNVTGLAVLSGTFGLNP